MTADVDITVDLRGASGVGFVDRLIRGGFALRIELGEDFLREAKLLPLVHVATEMPVDVVIANSSLQDEFLSRRKLVSMSGLRVPLISPEDLIVTKILAGRPKDIEDIRGVLLEQEALDFDRIRELLSELEEALGEHRLMRRFERLYRATRL